MVTADWKKFGGKKLIPDGEYDAIVKSADESTRASDGKPKWKIIFMITADGDYKNKEVHEYIHFTGDHAFNRVKWLGSVLGVDFDREGEFDIKPEDFVGKDLIIKVVTDEYEGQKNNKVKSFIESIPF